MMYIRFRQGAKMKKPGKLFFQASESPIIEIAGNTFFKVPIILQHVDTPLLEVVKTTNAGFTTQFSIYHPDGTYLAKVKGTQIYPTEAGKKAGLAMRHFPKGTALEMCGKTMFEVRREKAAALKASAELFTPTGSFVKFSQTEMSGHINIQGDQLTVGPVSIQRTHFQGLDIGIWIKQDGSVGLGVKL